MMPTSTVGSWRRDRGFTLIELVVVLVILGVAAAIVFPRLGDAFFNDYLGSSARGLLGMIRYTQSQAAVTGREKTLYYDLDKGEYWIAEPGEGGFEEIDADKIRKRYLPEGIRFQSITTQERVSGGIASSRFSPRGWVEKTSIHLKNEKGEELLIFIKPTGRAIIYDGHM